MNFGIPWETVVFGLNLRSFLLNSIFAKVFLTSPGWIGR